MFLLSDSVEFFRRHPNITLTIPSVHNIHLCTIFNNTSHSDSVESRRVALHVLVLHVDVVNAKEISETSPPLFF